MKKRIVSVILAACTMFLLMLDTQTAVMGAAEGIELCLNVLIPSLFPFFAVTSYLNAAMLGVSVPGLHLLRKLLHLPEGSEAILLMGLIGGYPVGAQLIGDAHENQQLSKRNAQIMLGYCSNAGPAFIFGVTSSLFSKARISLLLWGIHVFSAMVTALLLPKPEPAKMILHNEAKLTLVTSVKKSITITASVCSWVILFKIILSYLQLWITDPSSIIYLSGILELSNGCLQLTQLSDESRRFILCSGFLAFGGLCVFMQTASVTGKLSLGLYTAGKIMQTAISILTAMLLSLALYQNDVYPTVKLLLASLLCITIILITRKYSEKVVEKQ